mmetsp:Transcript_16469/g.33607  ORF Transcript_16469/g.33607 Transcript_16469/m.33607 type:complete len:222 (-) Transcript_16469:432-1097(-)
MQDVFRFLRLELGLDPANVVTFLKAKPQLFGLSVPHVLRPRWNVLVHQVGISASRFRLATGSLNASLLAVDAQHCLRFLQRTGFPNELVQLLFQRRPDIVECSAEILTTRWSFLVDTLRLNREMAMRNPEFLLVSTVDVTGPRHFWLERKGLSFSRSLADRAIQRYHFLESDTFFCDRTHSRQKPYRAFKALWQKSELADICLRAEQRAGDNYPSDSLSVR